MRADKVAVAVALAVSEEDGKPTQRVRVMNYSPECQHQQLIHLGPFMPCSSSPAKT